MRAASSVAPLIVTGTTMCWDSMQFTIRRIRHSHTTQHNTAHIGRHRSMSHESSEKQEDEDDKNERKKENI